MARVARSVFWSACFAIAVTLLGAAARNAREEALPRERPVDAATQPLAAMPRQEAPARLAPVPRKMPAITTPPAEPQRAARIPQEAGAAPVTPINMQAIAVIACSFTSPSGSERRIAYGSGAVVSEAGHIITARHVIDPAYAHRVTSGRQGFINYRREGCVAGMSDRESRAPTAQEIRAINPFTAVTGLPYRIETAYVPAGGGLSDPEKDFLDIAVMRITGVTEEAARLFGITLPPRFARVSAKPHIIPITGAEIMSFGFPSGAPAYGSSFQLQGSVGEVAAVIGGDVAFRAEPVGLEAIMETIGGRSGSPVFARDAMVGVVSAKEEYSKNATIVLIYPLAELLRQADESLHNELFK